LDKEKSKHVSLAQQKRFGLAFGHRLLRVVKGTTKQKTSQIRVSISSQPPICSPSFGFIGGVGKKVNN
jgi:hypothetical protein